MPRTTRNMRRSRNRGSSRRRRGTQKEGKRSRNRSSSRRMRRSRNRGSRRRRTQRGGGRIGEAVQMLDRTKPDDRNVLILRSNDNRHFEVFTRPTDYETGMPSLDITFVHGKLPSNILAALRRVVPDARGRGLSFKFKTWTDLKKGAHKIFKELKERGYLHHRPRLVPVSEWYEDEGSYEDSY